MSARRAPKCPYALGDAGLAWWKWAWKTPQAKLWDAGTTYTVARRALLEDDRQAAELADDSGLLDALLEGAEDAAIERVKYALRRLSAAATGSVGLSREMRELENQLGLNPKAAKGLGPAPTAEPKSPETDRIDELALRRLNSGTPDTASSVGS